LKCQLGETDTNSPFYSLVCPAQGQQWVKAAAGREVQKPETHWGSKGFAPCSCCHD